MPNPEERTPAGFVQKTIFASRWLQAPLYTGLIHLVFVASALALAMLDRIMFGVPQKH